MPLGSNRQKRKSIHFKEKLISIIIIQIIFKIDPVDGADLEYVELTLRDLNNSLKNQFQNRKIEVDWTRVTWLFVFAALINNMGGLSQSPDALLPFPIPNPSLNEGRLEFQFQKSLDQIEKDQKKKICVEGGIWI